MLAAGLLAKKAVDKGLKVKPYVKTSLAPGSRVVTDYFDKAGLTEPLDKIGFNTVGYGCTTCIGNSGPLPDAVAKAVTDGDLVASAVLSGNRNFEGRINPLVKANYLASPPLVVAYALAGHDRHRPGNEPLGTGKDGKPSVTSRTSGRRPRKSSRTIDSVRAARDVPAPLQQRVLLERNVERDADQRRASCTTGTTTSTYIQEPPFLVDLGARAEPIQPITGARVLAALGRLGDDRPHLAGRLDRGQAARPAGTCLSTACTPVDFNSYGARRGNDRVMTRGTFANIRIRNYLAPGTEGGVTRHLPDGELMSIYDAAMKYQAEKRAAGGPGRQRIRHRQQPRLGRQGHACCSACGPCSPISYERIHRSNLVGMGVLPLELPDGQTLAVAGPDRRRDVRHSWLDDNLQPGSMLTVHAPSSRRSGARARTAGCRIDTPVELDYYRNGGILQTVLRKLLAEG